MWNFGSLENFKFKRTQLKSMKDVLIRETNVSGMKAYVESIESPIISMSLWEKMEESPEDLYDNMTISGIKEKMNYKGDYIINSFDCYSNLVINSNTASTTDPKTAIEIIITELNLNVTPESVESVCLFMDYVKNMKIVDKLEAYRPIVLGKERKEVVRNRFLLGLWAKRIKKGKVKVLTENTNTQSAHIRVRMRFKTINSKFYTRRDNNPIVEAMIDNFAIEVQKIAARYSFQVIAKDVQITQHFFKYKQELTSKAIRAIRKTVPEMIIPETSFGKYRGNDRKVDRLYTKLNSISKDQDTKKSNAANTREIANLTKNHVQFVKRHVLVISHSKASKLAFTLNYTADKKIVIRSEIGLVNIEFFPELLKGMCRLILDYREMYWFRDWSMKVNNKSIIRAFNKIIKNFDVKVNIIPSEIILSLYEEKIYKDSVYVKPKPFFSITSPATNINFLCENQEIKASMFGFHINCSQSAIFVDMFIRKIKEEFSNSIISSFLKKYYMFYEGLAVKKGVVSLDDSSDANISENSSLQDFKEADMRNLRSSNGRNRVSISSITEVTTIKVPAISCEQYRNESNNSLINKSTLVSILSKSKGSKPKKTVHFNAETLERWNEKHGNKEKPKVVTSTISFENPHRIAFKQTSLPPGLAIRNQSVTKDY